MAINLEEKKYFLVSDHVFDVAYSKIDPKIKGLIKKSIAINYNILSKLYKDVESSTIQFFDTFQLHNIRRKKEDYCLCISGDGVSPVYIISAILILKFLNIKHFVLISYSESDYKIFVTLELLGEFDIYNLPQETFKEFLNEKRQFSNIINLGNTFEDNHIKNVSLYLPKHVAILRDLKDSKYKINKEYIEFVHPRATIEEIANDKLEWEKDILLKDFDAIYSEVKIPFKILTKMSCPVYGPGFELAWQWPALNKDVFYQENLVYWPS